MSKVYNPPPGWPAPPHSGWLPPPGWRPDPAWGPVPAGWELVVERGDFPADGALATDPSEHVTATGAMPRPRPRTYPVRVTNPGVIEELTRDADRNGFSAPAPPKSPSRRRRRIVTAVIGTVSILLFAGVATLVALSVTGRIVLEPPAQEESIGTVVTVEA